MRLHVWMQRLDCLLLHDCMLLLDCMPALDACLRPIACCCSIERFYSIVCLHLLACFHTYAGCCLIECLEWCLIETLAFVIIWNCGIWVSVSECQVHSIASRLLVAFRRYDYAEYYCRKAAGPTRPSAWIDCRAYPTLANELVHLEYTNRAVLGATLIKPF